MIERYRQLVATVDAHLDGLSPTEHRTLVIGLGLLAVFLLYAAPSLVIVLRGIGWLCAVIACYVGWKLTEREEQEK